MKRQFNSLLLLLICTFSYAQYGLPDFRPKIKRNDPLTYASLPQPDGKLLIAGLYDFVGDSVVRQVIRLNADGTLDPTFQLSREVNQNVVLDMDQGANGDVVLTILTFVDRIITIVDANGKFKGTIESPDEVGTITRVVPHLDGYLIQYYDFENRVDVLNRVDENGVLDPNFNIIDEGGGFSAVVNTNNDIWLIGGPQYQGESYGLVIYDENGNIKEDPGLKQIEGSLSGAVPMQGGRVALYGRITAFDGNALDLAIAVVDSLGQLEESFQPDFVDQLQSNTISTITVNEANEILFIGQASDTTFMLAKTDVAGTLQTSFEPIFLDRFANSFYYISDLGDHYVMAAREGFVVEDDYWQTLKFNDSGSVDSTYNQIDIFRTGEVHSAIELEDGSIIMGGEFSHVGNQRVNHLVKFNAEGDVDQDFVTNHPIGNRGDIDHIRNYDDTSFIIAGNVDAETSEEILRLNVDGTLDETFDTGFFGTSRNRSIRDIMVDGDDILAVGTFSDLVIRFDATGAEIAALPDQNFGDNERHWAGNIVKLPENRYAVAGLKLIFSPDFRQTGFLWILDENLEVDPDFPQLTNLVVSSDQMKSIDNKIWISGELSSSGQGEFDENPIIVYDLDDWGGFDVIVTTRKFSENKDFLFINDTTVLVGGDFQLVNEFETVDQGLFYVDGNVDETTTFRVTQQVESTRTNGFLPLSDGSILTYGQFEELNAVPFYSVGKLKLGNFIPTIAAELEQSINEDTILAVTELLEVTDLNDETTLSLLENDVVQLERDSIFLTPNFFGEVEASFFASDGRVNSDTITINLTVLPVNDAPVILEQTNFPTALPGTEYEVLISELSVEDVDNPTEELSVQLDEGTNYVVVDDAVLSLDEVYEGEVLVRLTISDGELSSEIFDFVLQSEIPLSNEQEVGLLIYPNPAVHAINVRSEKPIARFEMRNIQGQSVLSMAYEQEENTLPVAQLKPGTYFLTVIFENGENRQLKVIKRN